MRLDWKRLVESAPTFFSWKEARDAWDSMDVNLGSAPTDYAKELLGHTTRGCETCRASFDQLIWISIGTSDEAWKRGDERCGWLTLCSTCARQVDFILDEELTQLRREGNW